ncbi:MAG: adenosylcobinamide-GDP ribazoletransferase [Clostridia bacterium]|nr:adenosylcobinamide-GDP ribazoletransferase [Clostridia bacterium]
MKAIRSIITAFCMFSRIPMPEIEWKDDNMRFMLAAFPLVGVFVGFAAVLFLWISEKFAIPMLVRGAGLLILPLLITGGIHMDGFADVTDALSSHAPMEKKRAILKDPHAGAFAIIGVCAVSILNFACLSSFEISKESACLLFAVYVFSRAGSGICSILFPGSGEQGLLSSFRKSADKKFSLIVLFLWLVLISGFSVYVCGFYALLLPAVLVLTGAYLYRLSKKEFGGMSGDLSGWYLTVSECAMTIMLLVWEGVR